MAALNPVFHVESERIHHEHREMLTELAELDLALEHMGPGPGGFTDSRCVLKARSLSLALARHLPEHCMREEVHLYDTVAEVSPELAFFVQEMKRQHIAIFAQLNAFCVALDELPNAADLDAAVAHLKEQGFEVARALRQHITAEEHELQGFL